MPSSAGAGMLPLNPNERLKGSVPTASLGKIDYSCVCLCMYVGMYACMYVCMYVCIHVCMYVCMWVCSDGTCKVLLVCAMCCECLSEGWLMNMQRCIYIIVFVEPPFKQTETIQISLFLLQLCYVIQSMGTISFSASEHDNTPQI